MTVSSVGVAQRRHVLVWLRLWAGSRLQVTSGVVAGLVGVVVIVIAGGGGGGGQRTHHLAPRIVRQGAENVGRDGDRKWRDGVA